MTRLVFIGALAVLTVVSSFMGKCEQTSIAGMRMIRLCAISFLVTTVSDASRNERIAGGRWVHSPLTYPWIVSINAKYNGKNILRERFGVTFRCTGSFIDIYGSILTAGHCLPQKRRCYDHEDLISTCKLDKAFISWGSTSPLPDQVGGETAVITNTSIRRFEVQGLQLRRPIDVALIFLDRFAKTPMTANPETGPFVQPIKLTTVVEQSRPWIRDGTLIGFGSQPVRFNQTAWGYTTRNPLKEISMKYKGHIRKVCGVRIYALTKPTMLFEAQPIRDQRTDQADQLPPLYRGSCTGDSGGPYMVMEAGEEKLRGFHIKGVCTEEHPCDKFNDSSVLVDVNHKKIRDWLIEELKQRYTSMKVKVSAIPMTNMQAEAHRLHV